MKRGRIAVWITWGCLAGVLLAPGGTVWAQQAGATVTMGPPYARVRPAQLRPGDALPQATGPVLLTVYLPGAAGAAERVFRFDLATLERLGTVRFRSRNRWYPQPVTYEGVLGSALLNFLAVPADLHQMKMRALNDYVVHIPLSDFRTWPVVLATRLDGEPMPVREKGPLWIVYPNHVYPELGGAQYVDKWIWQLTEIRFEP